MIFDLIVFLVFLLIASGVIFPHHVNSILYATIPPGSRPGFEGLQRVSTVAMFIYLLLVCHGLMVNGDHRIAYWHFASSITKNVVVASIFLVLGFVFCLTPVRAMHFFIPQLKRFDQSTLEKSGRLKSVSRIFGILGLAIAALSTMQLSFNL